MPESAVPEPALAGRTIVMSGGSRGIGLAILIEAAKNGANAVILAKTDQPHPKLPGTVHTAVAEIEEAAAKAGVSAGGRAVAVVGDVRNEADVRRAVDAAAATFGGIDIVINNASALSKAGTLDLSLKQFDLMQAINVRGTFTLTQACLPYLLESGHAHILTMSPPLNLAPRWLGPFPAYTQTKYAMTLLTLGWAAELAGAGGGVAANCLWPQTRIGTAVTLNLTGGPEAMATSRTPQIMADAAIEVLSTPPGQRTGQTLIDADVLAAAGVTDLSPYGGGDSPVLDLYIDPPDGSEPSILAPRQGDSHV
jgi:NAD(P)-dependent dehydrogenase (short-subunit alcohol dehydrogenase family)